MSDQTITLSKYQKIIVCSSAILLTVQSLLWFLFSLICLIYYYKDLPNTSQASTFLDAVYLRFLDSTFFSKNQFPDNVLLDPAAFSAFNWINVFLDACLLIFALFQLHEIITSSKGLRKTLKKLSFNLLVICILDFFFVIGMGIDYGKTCVEPGSEINKNMCQNGVLPVLIIAAKGFVFWFINCSLIIILPRIARYLPLDTSDSAAVDLTIPAYDERHQVYAIENDDDDDLYRQRGPEYAYEYTRSERPVQALRYNPLTDAMEYYTTTEPYYEWRYVRKD